MYEESAFFLPVRDHCHRDLTTCHLEDPVLHAAVIMRDQGIPSIIACSDSGEPVGIMTDFDLRCKVVAGGLDPRVARVQEVMTTPVIAVQEEDTLFEALYQMSRNRIRRIGVVDADNKLVGMIHETDVIRLQNRSPQKLLRAIDEAPSISALRKIQADTEELVIFLTRAGVRTKDLVRLIAMVNDQLALRLIAILQREQYPELPEGFAFLVLGSEGRREQTLKTDQDNAIIYRDRLSSEKIRQIEAFSHTLIAALIEIGVPECPGGIMARNEFWRRSLSGWQGAIDDWVTVPSGENILNFSMFSDMRTLWGDPSLEQDLRAHIVLRAKENGLFLARMAQNVCRFMPPLGFFGGIKAQKQGEHAGKIDLKRAGIFALTEGIKTLALEAGILGGSTRDKLHQLGELDILEEQQVNDLEAAFTLLSFFRLRGQVDATAEDREPDNFISPTSLNRVEKARLQIALEVVRTFESTLKSHFQLNLLSG
jgi:CBS domain-containing protein